MKDLILRIRILKAFSDLVRDPRRTDKVFALSNLGRQQENPLAQQTISYIKSLPNVSEILEQNTKVHLPSLAELSQSPVGSFGRSYAEHMKINKLDPNFFPWEMNGSDEDRILNRVRSMHDLWHVLVGFDTSVPGELGLQAFTLAQLRSPLSALLIAGGILHSLTRGQKDFGHSIDCIFQGYQMGVQSRSLLGVQLEEHLDEDLSSLRQRFGIVVRHEQHARGFLDRPEGQSYL